MDWKNATKVETEKFLKDHGVNAQDKDGSTPLILASEHNSSKEVIQLLIDNGADLHARTEDGYTPLISASKYTSNPEVIQLLIDNGADVNAKDGGGWTPLMWALLKRKSSNKEVIQILIDNGADANVRTGDGWSPLTWALQYGVSKEVIEVLINYIIKSGIEVHWNEIWELVQKNADLKKETYQVIESLIQPQIKTFDEDNS